MKYVVKVTIGLDSKETIQHGPFTTRPKAEEFAIALAHGGCIRWSSRVEVVKK